MKTSTFWTSVVIATIIIFGAVAIISNSSDKPEESGVHGYIVFEPMEINIPVTHYDFSNEEPMLITPDMEE